MILEEVKMENFKVFRNDKVDFANRHITVITGPNGAGKTSIIEAITYALFGRAQSIETRDRKVTDLLRISGAGATERQMAATIKLMVGGHQLTVKRSHTIRGTSSLDVWVDGRRQNITSARSGDELIQRILRMDYQSFINSTIIRQGEMDKLTKMRGSDRKRIFAGLFNLDVYAKLDEKTREQLVEIGRKLQHAQGEIDGLAPLVSKEGDVKQQLSDAESELLRVDDEIRRLEQIASSATSVVVELEEKQKESIKLAKDLEGLGGRVASLENARKARERELEEVIRVERVLVELEAKHRDYQAKTAVLESLELTINQFHDLSNEKIRLEGDVRSEEVKLETEFAALEMEVRKDEEFIRNAEAELQQIPIIESEAENLRREIEQRETVPETLSQARTDLASKEANLRHAEDKRSTLKNEWKEIQQIGINAPCPLCKRKLSPEHFKVVEAEYASKIKTSEEEAAAADAEIQPLLSKIATLVAEETTSKALDRKRRTLEEKLLRLLDRQSTVLERRENLGQMQRSLDEHRNVLDTRVYAQKENARLEVITHQLMLLQPRVEEFGAVKKVVDEYRRQGVETKYASAQTTVGRKEALESEIESLTNDLYSIQTQIAETQQRYNGLQQALSEYVKEKRKLEEFQNELRREEKHKAATLARLGELRKQAEDIGNSRKRMAVEQQHLIDFKNDEEALTALRSVFVDLPVRILERLRPSLALEASDLLAAMTQNDFSEIELEDDFGVRILYQGDYRDINWFSGGQQVKVNMALRVAVAKMLAALPEVAEQLPTRQQTLIVDEGDFGSLDAAGVEAAAEAIRNLAACFQRIILVTHLDTLKEAFPDSIIEIKRIDQGESAVVPA